MNDKTLCTPHPTTTIARWIERGKDLHRCERGDIPIGQIVMIALVVVPLLLVLFYFRDQATNLIKTWWAKITSNNPATAN
jgi:hypothetical protein